MPIEKTMEEMMYMSEVTQPKILILGGGFGGLEAAFYLKMKLHDRARITLVSDKTFFNFKPNTIYIPFGLDPERLKVHLAPPCRKKNINFVSGRVSGIDPEEKKVRVGGETLPYDYLIVATGASMRAEEIPGLQENAFTIWTVEEMLRLRTGFSELLRKAKAGDTQRVLFMVPPNNKCSGPLYEMVLMLDTWLRRKRVREKVDIVWSTYERGYIQAFGPRLNEYIEHEFRRRGIEGFREHAARRVEKNQVVYDKGTLHFDFLISFPPYIASIPFPTLPSDARGFIAADLSTRQVHGRPDIYAVGDSADFPVKQAFLAFLQADAAAEHLSSRIMGREPSFGFVPTSMCVMEQFDKATFAQVPLRLTGIPDKPVDIREESIGLYRVGSSSVWRLGKWMLGVYLPWRFGAGEPFHAGLPWRGMEVGLKIMSALLAK